MGKEHPGMTKKVSEINPEVDSGNLLKM